jgi:hypothetical protein
MELNILKLDSLKRLMVFVPFSNESKQVRDSVSARLLVVIQTFDKATLLGSMKDLMEIMKLINATGAEKKKCVIAVVTLLVTISVPVGSTQDALLTVIASEGSSMVNTLFDIAPKLFKASAAKCGCML